MKRKGIFLLSIMFLGGAAFIWKFHQQIWDLITHPIDFFDKLLNAGGLVAPTVMGVSVGIATSLGSLIVELWIIGWDKSSLKRMLAYRDLSVRNDLFYWFLGLVNVYGFIGFLLSFGIFYFISVGIHHGISLNLLGGLENPTVLFFVIFILNDLVFYLWHLFSHKVNVFWQAHRFHHSATSFNMLTSSRVHFLARGSLAIFFSVFNALIGLPPDIFLFIYMIKEIWGIWLHSDITVNLGWVGRYIINTPQLHKIHHSMDENHHDKNFAFLFIFWDRLFGTYHRAVPVTEIGIPDNPYNKKGALHDVFHVWKRFFGAIFNS